MTMLELIIRDKSNKIYNIFLPKVILIENYILLLIAVCVIWEPTTNEKQLEIYKAYALNAVKFLLAFEQSKDDSINITRDNILNLFMCYSANFELFHNVIIEHLQTIINSVLTVDEQTIIKKNVNLGTCNIQFNPVYDKIIECNSFNNVVSIRNVLKYTFPLFVRGVNELVCHTKQCTLYDLMLVLMFDNKTIDLNTIRQGMCLIKMQNDLEAK